MPPHHKRQREALQRKSDKKAHKKRKRDQILRADKLGLAVEKKVPRTIENTREKDDTLVEAGDPILEADEAHDEFAKYFQHLSPPKLLLTTCYHPSKIMYRFLTDMLEMLTNAHYYKRQRYPVKKLVEFGIERGFTDLLIFNEDRKQLNGLLLVHLPDGPTAHFKLSNVVLCKEIKGHGRPTAHKPELILNHFATQLGRRIGRMIACLFSPAPAFRGRQVATFHNQRDYIFFRHHRYIFEKKERKSNDGQKTVGVVSRLQELGPRFTLRLRSLQKGTFDSKYGEFEWTRKPELSKSRRKFAL